MGTDASSWHRSCTDQEDLCPPFTAWVENATAALVLCQEQTGDGDVAQSHPGAPKLKFAAAWPGCIKEL